MVQKSKPKVPKEAKNVGRPSKFTKETRDAIIDAISHRVPYEYAAEGNGICEETLYDWLRTGKTDMLNGVDSDYAKFSQAIKRAEMTKMRQHSDIIAERPERWQADAWLLERRYAKHYGANAQVNELARRLDKLEHGESDNGEEKENPTR